MMQRLRVQGFSSSVDGYGAGPNQSLENPLGVGGDVLHEWLVHSRTFQQMRDRDGGRPGLTTTSLRAAPRTSASGSSAATCSPRAVAHGPTLLGSGEHLLAGLDLPAPGYVCTEQAASDKATHVVITKRA
jgi:hypothetical protein